MSLEDWHLERVNRILQNKRYQEYVEKNASHEVDRVFCHHDMEHFLAVARIGFLLNETEKYGQKKEFIYAAALLHDIGRWQQYETGEDHALVSSLLAPEILKECGFLKEEVEAIAFAIKTHREAERKEEKSLNGLLYRADKLSRSCFACKEEKNCNWKEGKKNLNLIL